MNWNHTKMKITITMCTFVVVVFVLIVDPEFYITINSLSIQNREKKHEEIYSHINVK